MLLWMYSPLPDLTIFSIYSLEIDAACSSGNPTDPGQPPRTTSSASRSTDGVGTMTTPMSFPSQTSLTDTAHAESPLSCKDIGCMAREAMRPVPECMTPFRCGVADPVRINRPLLSCSSDLYLTASHIAGTSCHSSMRCGDAPSNALLTSKRASSLFEKLLVGSASINALLECIVLVHVFPHHFGPSTTTAGNVVK